MMVLPLQKLGGHNCGQEQKGHLADSGVFRCGVKEIVNCTRHL